MFVDKIELIGFQVDRLYDLMPSFIFFAIGSTGPKVFLSGLVMIEKVIHKVK